MTLDVRLGHMTPEEFMAEQQRLGLESSRDTARILAVEVRTVNRWEAGERAVPKMVTLLMQKLTPREVKKRLVEYEEGKTKYIWPPGEKP